MIIPKSYRDLSKKYVKMSRFDRVSLIEFCDNKSIVLDSIPDKCNRDTRVSGPCLTENCDCRFEKSLRQLLDSGGPYCKECTTKRGMYKGIETNIKIYGVKNPLQNENIKEKSRQTRINKYGVEYPMQSEHVREKSRQTVLRRYGVDNISQVEQIKQKKKDTCLQHYGVEHQSQCEKIKQKKKDTCLQHYGVECSFQSDEVKKKVRETVSKIYGVDNVFQNENIKEKIRQTCLRNHGTEYPMQSEYVREKNRQTCIEKYGTEYPIQSEYVKEKSHQTSVEKYGTEYPMQSEYVREKSRQTCIDRYGVPFAIQNAEILERNQKAQYKRKLYITPSGEEWSLQGYEPLVAPRLIEQYQEENITSDIKIVPVIPWTDKDEKERRYFCDFYVESLKLIIEVKSDYTNQVSADKIQRTRKASNELGYDFRLIVLNKAGEWIEDITTSSQHPPYSTSSP
jgi:hypothetical protein